MRAAGLLIVIVLGVTPVAIGASASAQAPGPRYRLIVYTTVGAAGASPVGHAFVDLVNKQMNSHVIVGKYPSTSNYLSTPGSIMDDGAKVWSWRISFDLTTVPYRNVLAAIQNEKKHPSTYQLNSANCVQWVEQLVADAGRSLPPVKDWLGIPSPAVLRDALQKAGSGGTLNGGTVLQNTTGATASGAPDPISSPPCCDGPGMLQAAMTDPAGLAQNLDVQLNDRVLVPDHVNRDGSYRVEVTHTRSSQGIYGVVWGDGTSTYGHRPVTEGSTTVRFDHHYTAAPTQPVRVLVLENSELAEFDRILQPPDGTSGHKEVDAQPPPGPVQPYS